MSKAKQFGLGFLIAFLFCAFPWLLSAIGLEVLKLQFVVQLPGWFFGFLFGTAVFQDPRWVGDHPFAIWMFSFIFYGVATIEAIRFCRWVLDGKRGTETG